MARKVECPRCHEIKPVSRHHIFPVRFFGNGHRNNEKIALCWDCHMELEDMIPVDEEMPRSFYRQIVEEFLTA